MRKSMCLAALLLVSGIMACAEGKIEITKAEYGAKDKWTDVSAVVQSKIINGALKVDANGELCQDPAPGLPKILKITAMAGDKKAEFRCGEGMSIEINEAKIIAMAKAQAENRLVILCATYGAGDKTTDVSEKIKEQVSCGIKKITASNALFGDPASGEAKELIVKYKLDDKEICVSAKENETVDLP